MRSDQLTLQYDQEDRAVWLTVGSADAGRQEKELVQLRDGFGLEQVHQALLATGWVREYQGDLRLTCGTPIAALCDLVERMLEYFETPTDPRPALTEVQSAVEGYEAAQQDDLHVPLIAYAWLDIMVREDLADEARSAKRIWTDPELVIEFDSYCSRRVDELCRRYAPSSGMRMAPSTRTRPSDSGDSKRA